MNDFRQTLIGIGAIMASSACFITNDTLMKLASSDLPLGQVMLVRGLIASALIMAVAWHFRAFHGARQHLTGLFGLRTLGEVGAMVLYLTALFHMPIANSTAIMQIVPLMMTAAGAVFLGDKVGWRRWGAVAVGFAGILIIVRPGAEGFNIFSILALGAAVSVTLRDLATRRFPPSMPTLLVTAITTVVVMLVGGVISAGQAVSGTQFQPLTLEVLLLLTGSACFVLGGYTMVIVAMRHGDTLTVAPFRYTQVLWAIVAGFLIWGQVPEPLTFLGIAIVVGSGIYTVQRERIRQRAEKRAATALITNR
ncbi:phosphonate utilization associated putative membrane protein [Hartmannibacter diazotrophicus]|uniref:Phosphonate utilization associated putative membrane protein n=1 Tax=Hartmannibacter diazotrophicus TaxID=1482074 RepID=A0A2C9D848_9HYPH|nr:DMT family transporter [Hartmannibacter diazotrophicus]SON56446.1 phosphonate utilization associated putative membrane protein [Hartmannibacter diazotrophicus]